MRTPKLAAIAAAVAPLVLAAPVARASAATTPPASAPSPAAAPVFTFIPPKVGPLQVIIGATFIGGQQISPGVNVSTPGTSLPPITWTPPSS
ncbi:MAG: hypothetical protein QOD57_1598 [Actinomycetota bacterium]|jgi:hypothetical protein|nr:hypothetical protein [Actinomycetota bacterium]MDX6659141.1 hypothetical protein [Solirubrobacteraceae bacterium]